VTVRVPVSTSQRIDHSLPVCVGMASRASLDAAAVLAVERGRPAVLIASRRQVTGSTTPGYVGWTTLQWRARAGRTGLIAARDHGGPYQHPGDANRDPAAAMAAARQALLDDIDAGVPLLHVDTSLDAGGQPTDPGVALTRCVELVGACAAYAEATGRDVAYEVGLEVQATHVAPVRECREWTGTLLDELRRTCGVTPAFVVAQTGTHVADGRNRGDLHRDSTGAAGRALRELAAAVKALGCRLKAHNCDFLRREAIDVLRACGVWVNISPELGAAQTAAVLDTARQAGRAAAADRFAAAVLAAGHWRKWVTPGGPAGEWDRILLGGAYLFATGHFAELAAEVDPVLHTGGTSLHAIAVDAGVAVVRRYG
jgi:hypothetical protein